MTDVTRLLENSVETTDIEKKFALLLVKGAITSVTRPMTDYTV
jgi:hypothetical protein